MNTDKKGNMRGVLAKTKGEEINIKTRSVIIAAGGFGGNQELLAKYFPDTFDSKSEIFSNSVPQVTGDGLIMAEEAGAFIENGIDRLAVFMPLVTTPAAG